MIDFSSPGCHRDLICCIIFGLKYNIKGFGYPTKYEPLPTGFINPNTVELPEVEVAEADQLYDYGQIYIDSESEED